MPAFCGLNTLAITVPSKWEVVNISLENLKFWWETHDILGKEKGKPVILLLALVRALPPLVFQQPLWALLLQSSAYWSPHHSFSARSCTAAFGECVCSGISVLLPLVLRGKALTWGSSCHGNDPPGAASLSRNMPALTAPIRPGRLLTWQSEPTEGLKWSFLTEKDYTTRCHRCLWAAIAVLYTFPPPSANLHLNTHNQIEGRDQARSRLVREKLILHNAVQPALQSPVAVLL